MFVDQSTTTDKYLQRIFEKINVSQQLCARSSDISRTIVE